jgi:hypothetical protein
LCCITNADLDPIFNVSLVSLLVGQKLDVLINFEFVRKNPLYSRPLRFFHPVMAVNQDELTRRDFRPDPDQTEPRGLAWFSTW